MSQNYTNIQNFTKENYEKIFKYLEALQQVSVTKEKKI